MKLSLENTEKKQRVKNLWKVDYPPRDPEQRWIWIYQVEDHLFGTREMQNELLKAWGFSYKRKDRRKPPAVVHQSPVELWVYVLRRRRADKVNVKSTALAFTG